MTKGKTSNCVLFFRPRNKQSRGDEESAESIYRYARAKKWRVREVTDSLGISDTMSLILAWQPIGCLVDSEEIHLKTAAAFKGTPTAFSIESRRKLHPSRFASYAGHSEKGIAELAARHFRTLGFTNFAYVGYDDSCLWSAVRRDYFRQAVKCRPRNFPTFAFPAGPAVSSALRTRFCAWLRKLPVPCAVFVANDALAPELYDACGHVGFSIPEQISVVSVDDDERICRNLLPQLTSIRLDFRKAGWLLAEALDGLLDTDNPTSSFSTCDPLGLVPRKSTRRPANILSPSVALIQSRITEQVGRPVKVTDLIRGIKGCRRALEIEFLSETGTTILEAVKNARFDYAKKLLADPSVPLSSIPRLCGCASRSQFLGDFHKRFGQTMSAFRKNNTERQR